MLDTQKVARFPRTACRPGARTARPIDAAISAVSVALAEAHEAGDASTVRMLHAVQALLAAAPKANGH